MDSGVLADSESDLIDARFNSTALVFTFSTCRDCGLRESSWNSIYQSLISSHQFWLCISPEVPTLALFRILCLSGKDPFSYPYWFQWVAWYDLAYPRLAAHLIKSNPTCYLTFSIGNGLINKRAEVIVEAGIDNRMLNQWWSAVLILMVLVDEVKWLSELVETCTRQDVHRADGVLLSC